MNKYLKEAKKLLPERSKITKEEKYIANEFDYDYGFNSCLDLCTPIVAKLLKENKELRERVEGLPTEKEIKRILQIHLLPKVIKDESAEGLRIPEIAKALSERVKGGKG